MQHKAERRTKAAGEGTENDRTVKVSGKGLGQDQAVSG